LWRIRDLGEGPLVDEWVDERVAQRVFTDTFSALAVSPPMADGRYKLVVGTQAGEVWALDPDSLTWAPTLGLSLAEATPTATPLPTLIPTAVVTPTLATTSTRPLTATPTLTPTPAVSATRLATPTPGAALSGEPPAGLFRPGGVFAPQWESNVALQNQLGWATTALPGSTSAAQQPFERGVMIWRGDVGQIFVLSNDNRWFAYADTFVEGQAESDASLVAPAGKLQPIRGFGKLWREQVGLREQLGWATGKESGVTAQVQPFEHGFLIRLGGLVYALVEQADGQKKWLIV
jgi:serine/threonine-protein kinase